MYAARHVRYIAHQAFRGNGIVPPREMARILQSSCPTSSKSVQLRSKSGHVDIGANLVDSWPKPAPQLCGRIRPQLGPQVGPLLARSVLGGWPNLAAPGGGTMCAL